MTNSAGDFPRSFDELGGDFRVLASECRRISRCVIGVGEYCEKAGVRQDPVLDIAFAHVVSYIDEAAELLDQVAVRVANCAGDELADEVGLSFADGKATSVVEPEKKNSAVCFDASAALRDAAFDLEDAMNRALDLVDEVANDELVGDSHPFGHIMQGICIPYLLLASATLEQ